MKKQVIFTIIFVVSFGFLSAQKTSSFKIGKYKVHTISESQNQGSTKILIGASRDIIEKYAPEGTFPNAVNGFLIQTGSQNILVDAGLSPNFLDLLADLKVTPDQIDIVLLTHMHGDHIGSMIKDDKAVFEKAQVYISKPEYDHWLKPDVKNDKAKKVIATYERQLVLFDPSAVSQADVKDLIPNVKAFSAFGHTPGHTIFLLENNKEKFLIWGDLTHAMVFQMPYPEVAVTYDVDPKQATQSRQDVLRFAIDNKIEKVGGMHVPFPGAGRLEKEGIGYKFTAFRP